MGCLFLQNITYKPIQLYNNRNLRRVRSVLKKHNHLETSPLIDELFYEHD